MAEAKSQVMDWENKMKSSTEVLNYLAPGSGEDVVAEEIGDGNLNDVIRIFTKDKTGNMSKSIIIKHSMPYIKCLGEAYPLGVERIHMEYKGLQKFHQVSPGSVPEPYFFDEPDCSVGMEDLKDYKLLRHMLMDGECDLEIARNIGRHLGVVHRETHVATIGAEQLQKMDEEFENSNMLSITEQYVFTRPFKKEDETNKCTPEVKQTVADMYDNPTVMGTVQKMFKLFQEKKECLIHGDLHSGSIMVKDKDTRMFDLEFVYVGPAALDLGMIIANYIFSYYRHISTPENNDERRKFAYKMLDVCKETATAYFEHMTARVGTEEEYMSNFMSETAGFAGCELVRRTVGAAHVEDLQDIPHAEQESAAAGLRLLTAADRINTVDRLLVIALMLT